MQKTAAARIRALNLQAMLMRRKLWDLDKLTMDAIAARRCEKCGQIMMSRKTQ